MSSPTRFEQGRITQLISPYSPADPPRLPLDFGDYLSLLWRLDQCAGLPVRARYYRACATALITGLGLAAHPLARLVELTLPGDLYHQLPNLPYRAARLVDAQDRKAAIAQLITLRGDVLRFGTYQESWVTAYPGAGIVDTEVRERVFAVLFTALQGQFGNFARLLFVTDIVLADLLIGTDHSGAELALTELVTRHGWPDPAHPRTLKDYNGDKE